MPVNYVFNIKDEAKYAVNPLTVCYLADGQECVYDPRGEVKPAPTPDYEKLYKETLEELNKAREDLDAAYAKLSAITAALKTLSEAAKL